MSVFCRSVSQLLTLFSCKSNMLYRIVFLFFQAMNLWNIDEYLANSIYFLTYLRNPVKNFRNLGWKAMCCRNNSTKGREINDPCEQLNHEIVTYFIHFLFPCLQPNSPQGGLFFNEKHSIYSCFNWHLSGRTWYLINI